MTFEIPRRALLVGAVCLLAIAAPTPSTAASIPEGIDQDAVLMLNQGRKLAQSGRAREALPFFEQALDMAEAKVKRASAPLAFLLHELALVYRDAGQPERAESELRRALTMLEKSLGRDHKELLPVVEDLAEMLTEQDRLPEAEANYQRALELLRAHRQEGDPDIVATLGHLAFSADLQGRGSRAETLYRQAIELADAGRQESPELADALHNLATIYYHQGRVEEAETHFRRGLDLRRRLLGDHHWVVAVSLSDLAALLYARREVREARGLADRAAGLLEPYCGALNTEAQGVRRSAREVCRDNSTLRQRMARPSPSAATTSLPEVPEPSPESVRIQAEQSVRIDDEIFRVQLAARQDQSRARRELEQFRDRFPELLGPLPGHLETVDLGFKGIWHRLQFGSFGTYDEARTLCDDLRLAGLPDCWIAAP